MEDRRNIASLNLLRIWAAIGVMVAHFAAHLHAQLGVSIERADRLNFVDLFFVISGFLLFQVYGGKVLTSQGYWRFLRQRFARLYPLHVATCLTLVLIGIAIAASGVDIRVPATFDAGQLPQHLLLVHAWNTVASPGLNMPSWSLSAELFLLLLFPLLVRFQNAMGANGAFAMAIAIAAAFGISRHMAGATPWSEATFDLGMLRALPSFMAGMAAAAYFRSRPDWRLPWAVTLPLFCLVFGAMLADVQHEITMLAFPVLVACIASSDRRYSPAILHHRRVTFASNLTYGVFLLHTFVAIAMVFLVRKAGGLTPAAVWCVVAFCAALTFAMAAFIYAHFELPMRLWLSPRAPGEPAPAPIWLSLPQPQFARMALLLLPATAGAGLLSMLLQKGG